MFLNDRQIIAQCGWNLDTTGAKTVVYRKEDFLGNRMIEPFVPGKVSKLPDGQRVVSYGLSSFGYDARLSDKFKVFSKSSGLLRSITHVPIDPHALEDVGYDVVEAEEDGSIVIPSGGFLLGSTIEYFKIPRNVVAICVGKSTIARMGVEVIVTPLEPGWEGNVVIEIVNHNPRPVKIYANEGIAQFMFAMGDVPHMSYKDSGGKYQGQTGVQEAKI